MSNDTSNTEIIAKSPTSEWLTFRLDKLDYAVNILRVKEIRAWEDATRVPFSPHFVSGLINLRGAIVPVVNLRLRFHLESLPPSAETVILVMDIHDEGITKTVGMVVDAISEVVETSSDNSQLDPDFDLAIPRDFISGIADIGTSMLVLLNVDRVLDLEMPAFSQDS